MIKSFNPIIDENCKVLILGTMPGAESLRKQEYYGYERNQFWKIIFSLFDKELREDYEMKKKLVLENRIAIWDVLKSCERVTSSDSKIKNAVANDFNWLFSSFPNIKSIFFNGKKAEELYRRNVKDKLIQKELEQHILPSTSPANTISFQTKLGEWKQILLSLHQE